LIATPSEYGRPNESPDSSATTNTYANDLSKTRHLETERRYANEQRITVLKEVVAMEVKMSITTRWHPSTPEYINALRYMGRRDYEKAVDNLQRLVVQRLFELHKMNQSMNGTIS